jgi:hypothetical protein
MQEVFIVTRCDYPGCADANRKTSPDGQTTAKTEFLVNTVTRGRKTKPIIIELCEEHLAELRGIYTKMSKYDQKDETDE